jgi:hypothetical protein
MLYRVAYLIEGPQDTNGAPLTDIHVPENNTKFFCSLDHAFLNLK